MTESTARLYADILLEQFADERIFDLGRENVEELQQIGEALEERGCRVVWDEGRQFITVHQPVEAGRTGTAHLY